MKKSGRLTPLIAAGIAALLLAGGPAVSMTAGSGDSFERLKSLAGRWEGTNKDGKTTSATYAIVSDGTTVMETLNIGEEHGMVTMYHADGDRLMMTHYCGSGNQPRMRAEKGAAADMLKFAFVDATNLPTPQAGHMHSLALKFEGPDRLVHTWTWKEGSKESQEIITLARKK